ncbi:zeta toxin family protein [Streptomyces sp. NPDC021096]|uniref:zeta toxin family protein n=1 Tax=Streptomyces sp. NPDC021096 TaxID=3154792 RepID=UPI0033EFA279
MREDKIPPVVLPEDQHQEILAAEILPAWTKDAARQDRPVALFVSGPPGSGKTMLAGLLHTALDHRGGAVLVGRDLYKAAHHRYAELLAEDVRTAGVRVRPDTCRWQDEVEAYARSHRFDVVVETALADAEDFRATAAAYRQADYWIEVVALAVPEAVTQLNVLDRYVRQAQAGNARFVSWENHDRCVAGMLRTLEVIEAEHLADRLLVVRPGPHVLYRNELGPGGWRRPPAAKDTVVNARSRPWTAAETGHFRRALAQADRHAHDRRLPADWGLAVQRDAERAAAWAEPVRRIAQPRTGAPGVDYHRLSAHEHQWIFDELFAPAHLADIAPQERPAVVYVLGQPGTATMETVRLVLAALPGPSTWLTPGDFAAMHPDYWQLMQDEPRTAEQRIGADCAAWQAKAEAYVRARRGNLVLALSPDSAGEFLSSAAGFRQAGYRIEVVVPALRAADSRQAGAARYARAVRSGPASFPSAARHDRSLQAVIDAVTAAEQQTVADSVVLLRPDESALYRNHRGDDGRWTHRAGAAHALVLEQQRPYTFPEAMRFLSVQRWLRAALPEYRDELLEAEELARPLLPAPLQPRRLERPAPLAALPLPAQHQAGAGAYDSLSFLTRAS